MTQSMKTVETLTDAEYAFYEKRKRTGERIFPDQVRTCTHCGQPYKMVMSSGASLVFCNSDDCRTAAHQEKVRLNRDGNKQHAMDKRNARPWRHNDRRHERQNRVLKQAAEFSYA